MVSSQLEFYPGVCFPLSCVLHPSIIIAGKQFLQRAADVKSVCRLQVLGITKDAFCRLQMLGEVLGPLFLSGYKEKFSLLRLLFGPSIFPSDVF